MIINPYRYASGGGGGGGGGADPSFSSVVLLIGADTSLVDESGTPATLTGAATRTTTGPKFGVGCVDCGTGRINSADAARWEFGISNFTVEGWFNFTSTASTQRLINHTAPVPGLGWNFFLFGGNTLMMSVSSTGSSLDMVNNVGGPWTPTIGTWHHLCFERSGSTFRLYADGVVIATATSAGTINDSTGDLEIGADDGFQPFGGKVDEIRITNGVARYNGAFSAPTAAFPRS